MIYEESCIGIGLKGSRNNKDDEHKVGDDTFPYRRLKASLRCRRVFLDKGISLNGT